MTAASAAFRDFVAVVYGAIQFHESALRGQVVITPTAASGNHDNPDDSVASVSWREAPLRGNTGAAVG
jgi:hypothetical protein